MISKRAIQLTNGQYFDVSRPNFDLIDIEVIADGLSKTNRFAGHTSEPYSVAQHSVLVSYMCDHEDAQHGILHDASEGLGLTDIPRPIKDLFPEYKVIERQIMDGVFDKYNLDRCLPKSVHTADLRMCLTEARDLVDTESWKDWHIDDVPYPNLTIHPWNWKTARYAFIYRCKELNLL